MDFQEKVQEAKNLFNKYSETKNIYSNSKITENETALKNSLALLLRQVRDMCRELRTLSDSKIERDLFRQFAGE